MGNYNPDFANVKQESVQYAFFIKEKTEDVFDFLRVLLKKCSFLQEKMKKPYFQA